jgi:hypothetical protein
VSAEANPELRSTDDLVEHHPHPVGRIGPDCSEAVDVLHRSLAAPAR